MKGIIQQFFAVSLLMAPLAASAGVAVIANPALPAGTLTADQVSQVFMGRWKTLPGGMALVAIDQQEGSPVRAEFLDRVLGKSEQQMRSYWTRMVFTGKGQPPRSVERDADVLRAVISTPGSIGYVDSKAVTPQVKVLYRLE